MHDLGLHPGFFTLLPVEEALSTLVHEMVHHWQECFGTPTKSNHHNRQWVAKMESLGLVPSNTGLPGGEQTGRKVTHYIQPEGSFMKACQVLIDDGFSLPWYDRHVPQESEEVQQVSEALSAEGFATSQSPAPWETLPEPAASEIDPTPPPRIFTPPVRKPTPPRMRMICPECQALTWTEPDNELFCGLCKVEMATG